MDINDKIKEKEEEFRKAGETIAQLNRFQLTLQGYLEALYEQRAEATKEKTTEELENE